MKVLKKVLPFILLLMSAKFTLYARIPKVAVVLGGGGAKGVAEVALLQALEEEGIPVDMILGTSMGALIAAFYSCGYTALEVRQILYDVDMVGAINETASETEKRQLSPFDFYKNNITTINFTDKGIGSAPALFGDQKVLNILSRYIKKQSYITDFDKLPIPYRSVSTDIFTGKAIVNSSGSLLYAARGSMSLPVVFTPTPTQDGKLAFDGCLSNNLPIETAREMGADIVIAMDVSSYTNIGAEDLTNINSIAVHAFNLMVNPKSMSQYQYADFVINADISEYSMIDYMSSREILDAGYKAVENQRKELHNLALKMESMGVVLDKKDLNRKSYYSTLKEPFIERVEIRDISVMGECPLPKDKDFRNFIGKNLDDDMTVKLEKKLDELKYSYNLSSLSYELRQGSQEDKYILLICANHYEQKTDSVFIGGNPAFLISGGKNSDLHSTLSPEVIMGINYKTHVPVEVLADLGDEHSIRFSYNPSTDKNDRFNVGLDLGAGIKGGSLSVNNSIFYSDHDIASDFGFDAHTFVNIFYVDFATFKFAIKYDFNYLKSDKSYYNLVYGEYSQAISTLKNYALGLSGYRIDFDVKAGFSLPYDFLYSASFGWRQRICLVEDICALGLDASICTGKFPYKLKSGYSDFGGFNGMCGYSLGSLAKDIVLLGLQYQHRIFSIADMPLYAVAQIKCGFTGDYNPYRSETDSLKIPFYIENLKDNLKVGFASYFAIDSLIGNLYAGFGYCLDGSYTVSIGIM